MSGEPNSRDRVQDQGDNDTTVAAVIDAPPSNTESSDLQKMRCDPNQSPMHTATTSTVLHEPRFLFVLHHDWIDHAVTDISKVGTTCAAMARVLAAFPWLDRMPIHDTHTTIMF